MVKKDTFIQEFSKEVRSHNAAIFAGAGLSISAGYVDWKELLRGIAEELNLDVDKEHDLVTLAQFHVNNNSGHRTGLNEAILENFCRTTQTTQNHKILARLPIKIYWTTNYDEQIEKSLEAESKVPDVKHRKEDLVRTVPNRDAVVYKMHGDVKAPDAAVLTKEDYELYRKKRGSFITALSGDFVSKTFLFLGFSFTDPNLNFVLSKIRGEFENNSKRHFCILKKESKIDDNDNEYEYRTIRQEHFIKELQRYNILTVLVDSYEEITEILSEVEKKIKKDTVFISGAAHEYGDFTQDQAFDFCSYISEKLIHNGFKVVTGLGLGIGSSVIDGALREIYLKQKVTLKDQIIFRPFPQSEEGKKAWTQYRNDMLSYSGIAFFVFGNKLQGDKAVESNGMIEEFNIAQEKGLLLLPIGFTGYVAKKLWDDIMDKFEEYYPNASNKFAEAFKRLGESGLSMQQKKKVVDDLLDALN